MKYKKTENMDLTELFRTLRTLREDIFKHCALVGCKNLPSCRLKCSVCNEGSPEALKAKARGAKFNPYFGLRNFLIEVTLPHVGRMVRAPAGSDLYQDGCLRLIRAVELYDPAKSKFTTYLYIHMQKVLKKQVEKIPLVHKPHSVTDYIPSISMAYEYLSQRGEEVTPHSVTLTINRIRIERDMKKISIPRRILLEELRILRSWENFVRKREVPDSGTHSEQDHNYGLYDLMCNSMEEELKLVNKKLAEQIRMRFGLPPYTKPHHFSTIGTTFGITEDDVRINLKNFFKTRAQSIERKMDIFYPKEVRD